MLRLEWETKDQKVVLEQMPIIQKVQVVVFLCVYADLYVCMYVCMCIINFLNKVVLQRGGVEGGQKKKKYKK